jgi:hypothetical protein
MTFEPPNSDDFQNGADTPTPTFAGEVMRREII